MSVTIQRVSADQLAPYASIPMALTVRTAFRVEALAGGLGGLALVEEAVPSAYVKCYDKGDPEDSEVMAWSAQFDISRWGFFLAVKGNRAVGGAAVAFDTPAVHVLESRRDLAVLWDIRVHCDERRRGIGTQLFGAAAQWARDNGCTQLKIETQNINVPACRFYRKQGCELGGIHRFFYAGVPEVAGEVALFWHLAL
jgi:streptothricin acetyltransferase